MPEPRKRARRNRDARRRRRPLDYSELLPRFLRPSSRAWKHFQAAKVEFCEGLRAALDEAIEEMRRGARHREAAELTRIRVQD